MRDKIQAIKKYVLVVLLSQSVALVFAQQSPFSIAVEPTTVSGLGGIQSYAFGQHNGKWLIVGGRLDGLHKRQPFASFDVAGHNNQLVVVDIENNQVWTAPLHSLSARLQEQLSATNMNFYQTKGYLYCVGGYGYSQTEDDHITYPYLSVLNVEAVIAAVIHKQDFAPFIRQYEDSLFQVTGGRLRKLGETFYLLGGQKFMGRYNPHDGPSFEQTYTNEIRRFEIKDNGIDLQVKHIGVYKDSMLLHRRDYNAEPQIMPNGKQGITMFSGVFKPTADLPFLHAVTVESDGFALQKGFEQLYNHYHCATIPMYAESANQMHTVFFGGIAQFFDSSGILVQDDDMPFVKTIARVTRDAMNEMVEYKLPVQMPALLGAGSEFIPHHTLAFYDNGVLKFEELMPDSAICIGYIFGGIVSNAPHVFWSHMDNQSAANSQVFKVFLTRNTAIQEDSIALQANSFQKVRVYPQKEGVRLEVDFYLNQIVDVRFVVRNEKGKIVQQIPIQSPQLGKQTITFNLKKPRKQKVYHLELSSKEDLVSLRILLLK